MNFARIQMNNLSTYVQNGHFRYRFFCNVSFDIFELFRAGSEDEERRAFDFAKHPTAGFGASGASKHSLKFSGGLFATHPGSAISHPLATAFNQIDFADNSVTHAAAS